MAKAGDELVNTVTGLRTVFRKTARIRAASCSRSIGSAILAGQRAQTTSIRSRRSDSRLSVASWVYGCKASSASSAREGMIFGVLAKVARLLGYRAEYPYARRSEISQAGMQPDAPQRTT
jgi:hypothetical protein